MGKRNWVTVWDTEDGVPVDVVVEPDDLKESFHVKVCKRCQVEVCITFRVSRADFDGLVAWAEGMLK